MPQLDLTKIINQFLNQLNIKIMNFLKHQGVNPNKHTRRTFAGNFIENENKLVIGIAGNHESDMFCKSKGRQIATGRASVIRQNLQDSGKQIILDNVSKEQARDRFFETVNTL